MKGPVKLLVDGMLGSIARFLRILGHDTLYFRDLSDKKLIEIAKDEDRVLITCDQELHRMASSRGVKSIFVESDVSKEVQLARIMVALGIEPTFNPERTRCPLCNNPLIKTSKDRVKGKVPEKSYELYDDFWICPGCGKVYWIGSHWRQIRNFLERVERHYLELLG